MGEGAEKMAGNTCLCCVHCEVYVYSRHEYYEEVRVVRRYQIVEENVTQQPKPTLLQFIPLVMLNIELKV